MSCTGQFNYTASLATKHLFSIYRRVLAGSMLVIRIMNDFSGAVNMSNLVVSEAR